MRYCPLAVWCEVPFRSEDPCFLQEGVPNHASFGVFSVELYRSFSLQIAALWTAFQRSWKLWNQSLLERCVYSNFQKVMQKGKARPKCTRVTLTCFVFTVACALVAQECRWLDICLVFALFTLDVSCWHPFCNFGLSFFIVSYDSSLVFQNTGFKGSILFTT